MANGMAKELRTRGYVPEEFTMLAYGGNGPLHCCGIADHLGMDRILAPPFSSVFSALRRRQHAPDAHPREHRPVMLFDADQPPAVRRLRARSTQSSRSSRGEGPSRPAAAGTARRRGPSPPRTRHALRQPAGDDGRRRRPHAAAQRPRRDRADRPVPPATTATASARAASRPRPASGSPPSAWRPTCEGETVEFDAALPTGTPKAATAVGPAPLPLRRCATAR